MTDPQQQYRDTQRREKVFKTELKPGEPGTREYLEGRVEQLEFHNSVLEKYRKDTDFPYEELAKPFKPQEVEWRMQRAGLTEKGPWGIVVPYLEARAIMNRLDDVAGPHKWQNQYDIHEKGILCTISIQINGEWVSKQDGASFTEIEEFKGGLSGAFKRAAVHWGMGRYLYSMDIVYARFVEKNTPGAQFQKIKDKQGGEHPFYWVPNIKS